MPNIFKSFLRPAVNNYIFPDAESIQMEEPEPEEPAEPMEEPAPAGEDTQRPSGEEERQNAASVISFAKIQADQIVADAHRQAEELMEEGRRKLQEEAETAREEARNDGYRQGYTEGLRQAQVEGARAREEQSRQEAEQVQSFLILTDHAFFTVPRADCLNRPISGLSPKGSVQLLFQPASAPPLPDHPTQFPLRLPDGKSPCTYM